MWIHLFRSCTGDYEYLNLNNCRNISFLVDNLDEGLYIMYVNFDEIKEHSEAQYLVAEKEMHRIIKLMKPRECYDKEEG